MTESDIRSAYRIAAHWVVQDPAYAPIFERMEAEVARLDTAASNCPADRAPLQQLRRDRARPAIHPPNLQ